MNSSGALGGWLARCVVVGVVLSDDTCSDEQWRGGAHLQAVFLTEILPHDVNYGAHAHTAHSCYEQPPAACVGLAPGLSGAVHTCRVRGLEGPHRHGRQRACVCECCGDEGDRRQCGARRAGDRGPAPLLRVARGLELRARPCRQMFGSPSIILDVDKCKETDAELREKYNIHTACSMNLRADNATPAATAPPGAGNVTSTQ